MKIEKWQSLTLLFFLQACLLSSRSVAAPGELADKPLFLGTSIQPNIFFLIDDSGSMGWEVLLSNGAETAHPGAPDWEPLDFTPDSAEEARELCVGYNVMAYDPTKEYTPWVGVDQNGDRFADQTAAAAYFEAYYTESPSSLMNHFYIAWDDDNGDGEYQNGECDHTGADGSTPSSNLWSVSDGSDSYTSSSYDITGESTVTISVGTDNPHEFESSGSAMDALTITYRVDSGALQTVVAVVGALYDQTILIPVAGSSIQFFATGNTTASNETYFIYDIIVGDGDPTCPSCVYVRDMTAAEQTNYANWYTYYRQREFVAKRALSEIISDGRSRMGLATLHNNESVGTIIEDIDNISTGDPTAAANKLALLRNLFRIHSGGGTPLRRNLEQVGDYFEVGVTPSSGLFGFTPSPTSPIVSEAQGGACQQNFTVLLSDGYWNGSAPNVGNTDGPNSGNTAFDGASYADGYSNTLADVAMDFYERDLAPALPDNVPVTAGIDTNTSQHMVTFTVAFGVDGTLASDPPNRTDTFAWPQASADSARSIDDMRHAAWNGRGEFLNANNPQELIDSLGASISSIQDRTGSASAVAFNTTSITANTYVYQARFDSGNWSGQLYAFEFDADGVGNVVWEASERMVDAVLPWNERRIYTYREDTGRGIPFAFPADYNTRLASMPDDSGLGETQIRDLMSNAPFSLSTTDADEISANEDFGESVVDYLKGDTSYVGRFRDRQGNRLGDIVHSSPEYVGEPSELYPNFIETTSYFDFASSNANRTPVVYVGANDGMLHAFHAEQGQELFAYIPGTLFADGDLGLHKLTEHDYGHLAYVDASPVSRDVFVNNAWKTYLVGGYRAGGKGIYVLDVTNPTTYTTVSNDAADQLSVLEFTHNDLGYTFSNPQIAKLNNGKWAAIFGNGYNNDPTGDGEAKLFLLYLDGSGYEVIETETGSMVNNDCSDSGSDCNGLSSPSLIDTNSDFIVDRVYAGDLQGNMWVFDISSTSTSNWGPAFGTVASPLPLFTACTSNTCTDSGRPVNRQPITTKPVAVPHPSVSGAATFPNVLVLFGTGQYIATYDNTDNSMQSFYGVWDAGNSYDELGRADLVEQTFSYPNNSDLTGGRVLSSNEVSYNPSATPTPEMGWYIDFQEPDSSLVGERIAVDPIVASDFVFFNTTIPNDAVCSAGGSGFLMVADMRTGGQPERLVFESFNLGNREETLTNTYAGIPINAVPGGGTLINGDTVVVSDSLGRVITAEFDPTAEENNSRRSSWSIVK